MKRRLALAVAAASVIFAVPASAHAPLSGVAAASEMLAAHLASDVAAKKRANVKAKPVKHRHWRHRGGRHPHFGGRPLRHPR